MSGTPTPAPGTNIDVYATSAAECTAVSGLLRYLLHPRFLPENGGRQAFNDEFLRGWKAGDYDAFFRLCCLLREVMVRHNKR